MIFHIYQEDFGHGKQFLHLKFLCFDWWEIYDWGYSSDVDLVWSSETNSFKKYLLIRQNAKLIGRFKSWKKCKGYK
jgi:hypothetical protein